MPRIRPESNTVHVPASTIIDINYYEHEKQLRYDRSYIIQVRKTWETHHRPWSFLSYYPGYYSLLVAINLSHFCFYLISISSSLHPHFQLFRKADPNAWLFIGLIRNRTNTLFTLKPFMPKFFLPLGHLFGVFMSLNYTRVPFQYSIQWDSIHLYSSSVRCHFQPGTKSLTNSLRD